MNLRSYVPKDKHDIKAIERARLIGFPVLNPIIPELLTWLQDINWPVASECVKLLSHADSEIVPHIQSILRSDDSIWKYWILNALCPRLAPDILATLRCDIKELTTDATQNDKAEEVDQAANELLSAHLAGNI